MTSMVGAAVLGVLVLLVLGGLLALTAAWLPRPVSWKQSITLNTLKESRRGLRAFSPDLNGNTTGLLWKAIYVWPALLTPQMCR